MNKVKILGILGVIFICSSTQADNLNNQGVIQEKVGSGSFVPQDQSPVSYQDSNLAIRSIHPIGHEISIQIQELASQSKGLLSYQVTLPDQVAQLNEVRPIYGDKIVSIGLVNSAVSMVNIIDRNTETIVDSFYAYKPAVSPNGRWIAFQEFFPPHGDENIRSCYRVYDSSLNAIQNRQNLVGVSDLQVVGFSIYPVRPRSQEVECGATIKDGEFMMSTDTFFWGEQSDQFFFAISEKDALNLVLVKLDKNPKWKTFIYNLNKDKNFCASTDCSTAKVTSLKLKNNVVDTQVFPGDLGKESSSISVPTDEFSLLKP